MKINVENQISLIKPLEFNNMNSINTFNYIYKKATIKEKYMNMVNEIRSLNFEKIVNNKMQHMDFNYLINSIINLKKIINNNNPYMRYIKYVKPYNLIKSKVNLKKKNTKKLLLFYTKNKINFNQNSLKTKEKLIDFNKNKKNCRNFYFTRMCNIEYKKINNNITEKIIIIQKNIKGFLRKKIIDENINNEIAKNIINSILIIQRGFRKFLLRKNSLDKLIINIIKNERITKANKITDIFSLYYYRNLYKKHLIIKKIVICRHKSASLIQSIFKSYLVHKKVQKILTKEKNSYILTYPFTAQNVQIKIYMNNGDQIYNYFICPIRKYFIAYIDKKKIEAGEYLCHIIVDSNIKIDNRYKITNKSNIIYNLISFGNYYNKRRKPKQIEIEIEKKNKEIKRQKDKEKKINDEMENFYIYYYNNNEENDKDKDDNEINTNSSNSFSTKSEIVKNKLDYRNQIDEDDPDQVIDISNQMYKSKINNFLLKSNYKYIKNYSKPNLTEIENKKKKKKNISKKENKLKEYLKKNYDEIQMKNILKKFDIEDSKEEEDSINKSESLNYNNILDELSESLSSVVSNISMKNINFYSKKTHKTKYTNRDGEKKVINGRIKNKNSLIKKRKKSKKKEDKSNHSISNLNKNNK